MKLKCMVIDDEPNAVNLLEVLIAQATDWEIVARCYDGLEALQALKLHQPDFIFLDINIPHLNGLELAALLPQETRIVFTTAYSEYGAESYNFSAIDYLLKPVTLKRFLLAQRKIEAYFLAYHTKTAVAREALPADFYFVKTGKTHHKILLSEILYFEGEKEYIQLVTLTEKLLIYRRMKEVAEQLPYPYVRVHNSFIVNMDHILKFEDNHILIGNRRIPVSDKYRAQFMASLSGRLF